MTEIGSVQKTRKHFPKILHGLKSFLYKRCQKLPRSSLLRPFSCGSTRHKVHRADQCYIDCPYHREFDTDEKMPNNPVASPKEQYKKGEGDGGVCSGSSIKFLRPCLEERKIGKRSLSFHPEKGEDVCSEDLIEEKMRELQKMDVGDLENVLDMEEALHYYSCLRSPVYLGIVNKFLMDMYSDFEVPKASVRTNSFKKRFVSARI